MLVTSVRRILDTRHLNKELDWVSAIQKRTVHEADELNWKSLAQSSGLLIRAKGAVPLERAILFEVQHCTWHM